MARSWEMEEARKQRLKQLLPDLRERVTPSEILPYLTECISDQTAEGVIREEKNEGPIRASYKLFSSIWKKQNWYEQVVAALRYAGHSDLADRLEGPELSSRVVKTPLSQPGPPGSGGDGGSSGHQTVSASRPMQESREPEASVSRTLPVMRQDNTAAPAPNDAEKEGEAKVEQAAAQPQSQELSPRSSGTESPVVISTPGSSPRSDPSGASTPDSNNPSPRVLVAMETRVSEAESPYGRFPVGSRQEIDEEPGNVPSTDAALLPHMLDASLPEEEKILNDRESSKIPLELPMTGADSFGMEKASSFSEIDHQIDRDMSKITLELPTTDAVDSFGTEKVGASAMVRNSHQGGYGVKEMHTDDERETLAARQDGATASGGDMEISRKWNIHEGERLYRPPPKPSGQLNIDILKQHQGGGSDAFVKLNDLSPTKPGKKMNIPPSYGTAGETLPQRGDRESPAVPQDTSVLSVALPLSEHDRDPRCEQALDALCSNGLEFDSTKSIGNGSGSKIGDGGSEEKNEEIQNGENQTSMNPGLFRSMSVKLVNLVSERMLQP